jgi:hypothetical protein
VSPDSIKTLTGWKTVLQRALARLAGQVFPPQITVKKCSEEQKKKENL